MTGLNKSIEISFLLVGHTKFAPDWCFGLLKQKFRKSSVGCLDDLVGVVKQSAEVNYAQLVGREDGTVYVQQYDWAEYFAPFFKRTAFDGIKSWHHLAFSSTTPGQCQVRTYSNSAPKTISILSDDYTSWQPDPYTMPPVIKPPGISEKRKSYLYKKIREFVPERSKDILCPRPSSMAPCSPSPPPSPPSPPSHSPTPTPPAKRRRS